MLLVYDSLDEETWIKFHPPKSFWILYALSMIINLKSVLEQYMVYSSY